MKTMAEVIADVLATHSNLEWSFEYGGFVCAECGWQEIYARPYEQEAQVKARTNHQATALSTALVAAGYGPVREAAAKALRDAADELEYGNPVGSLLEERAAALEAP